MFYLLLIKKAKTTGRIKILKKNIALNSNEEVDEA